ncbi:MAG: aromatic amino acid lyase [Pseudomonadota bacterium]
MSDLELSGGDLTVAALTAIADGATVRLSPAALLRMGEAREVIDRAVRDKTPVYGVTTGLGPRAVEALPEAELEAFALRTVRGRAHSAGADLPERVCRAALAVRCNTLLIGAAGAKPALAEALAAMLNAGLAPAMRGVGSIGAADLMWGGDFGNAVIGEGRMWRDGEVVPAAEALVDAGLAPYAPGPREGLALVSHSSPSGALAALAVAGAEGAYQALQKAAALSMEGFRANLSILDPDLLALRPQPGQTAAARGLAALLDGSALRSPGAARRLQDPLSIRNIPQVHGALRAALDCACTAVEAEINGASDNPGVMIERGEVASHGGYLTPHLAIALGALGQAVTMATATEVQRIAKLTAARFSGLENGLTDVGAAGAGLGPVMKTAEALWAEIAHEAAPAPIYPSSSADGLEDVAVSTGLAGNALLRLLAHMRRLIAIEMIVAAQAVEQRALGDGLAPALRPIQTMVRDASPTFREDRALGDEIEALAARL